MYKSSAFALDTSHSFRLLCMYVLILVMHAGPNAALLDQARAHEPVLVAMRTHADLADVQGAACRMLYKMAANNGEWLLQFFLFLVHAEQHPCLLRSHDACQMLGWCMQARTEHFGDGGHASRCWRPCERTPTRRMFRNTGNF